MQDLSGEEIEVGNIVAFADSAGQLQLGVVKSVDEDVIKTSKLVMGLRIIVFSDVTVTAEAGVITVPKKQFDPDKPIGRAILREQERIIAS